MECQQCGKETKIVFVYKPLIVCLSCYHGLSTGKLKPKEAKQTNGIAN